MNITVVGLGYVGLSLSVVLSKKNKVTVLDINKEKIDMLNAGISPIDDELATEYLSKKENNKPFGTHNKELAYSDADIVIVSVPTDYDEKLNYFNTSLVEIVCKEAIEANDHCLVVIKSTIPIGFTEQLKKDLNTDRILFSPEFMREGKAVYDNLYPDRIVVGTQSQSAKLFGSLLKECSIYQVDTIYTKTNTEAEAIKLFSNTYLAMRVAFFNELDTYARSMGLDTESIVLGVSGDKRIGNFYNNPSFGYGGYCFIKDIQQLSSNMKELDTNIIHSIHQSNINRKQFIANNILKENPKTVGIYKLSMKANSDNFRNSAIFDIMAILKQNGVEVIIYEPTISYDTYFGYDVTKELVDLSSKCDIIIANRIDKDIEEFDNVYTCDIFNSDL